MSLNESRNNEQATLRLPALSTTPSVDQLKEALQLASNNFQNMIELPWKSSSNPINYMIKVSCQANPQEPSWILYVGGEVDSAVLWNYNTANCEIVHSLIIAEVDRAAYAAGFQPVSASSSSPLAPPQLSEHAAQPFLPQGDQSPSGAAQNQAAGSDWGSGQSSSQQGQDWSWSSPTAAANTNWSTSGHSPVNLRPEPIVPINDPQAFSQSWGAPAPAITANDSGLQRTTKPPGSVTPAPVLQNPLASGNSAPLPNISSSVISSSRSASLPLAQNSGAFPSKSAENPSLPIGGFEHSTPFAMSAIPAVAPVAPAATAGGAIFGVETMDTEPVISPVADVAALNAQTTPSNYANANTSTSGNSDVRALPVVPSGRNYLTNTLSATLPLNVQETMTPDENSLTAPRIDAADLSYAPPKEIEASLAEAPLEAAAKQVNKRKGRSSKINLPALPNPADSADTSPLDLSSPQAPPSALPRPFVVEVDPTDRSGAEQIARMMSADEIDTTVPLNSVTGNDIENYRSLHQAPEPVSDLVFSQEPTLERSASALSTGAVVLAETPLAAPVEQKPPIESAPKRALPPPAPFNREAVDVIFKYLTNEETGFLTNSAFMFFLVREFSRFQKAQTPITLIGFELALRAPDGAMYPVHLEALRECGRRFFSVMRPLDWLSHYSDDEYALLLPHANIREAILLVKELYTVLNQGPLLPGMEDAQVVMYCGIASIPEDCQHPGILIAAAYEAKNEAKRSNLALQLFRDMPD